MRSLSDCVGADAEAKRKALRDGEVLLLENVRFHPEEEANDPEFSKQLAALCDGLFVCDAFGSAHRAHASVVGITKFVRQAAAGLLMEKELAYLGKAISNPDRPFVSVLGGAKVSDKIEVVQNLMKLADAMLIGGAMAYTFLKSQGLPVGKSLVENDKLDLARELLMEARERKFRAAPAGGPCARGVAEFHRNQDHRHRAHARQLDGARHRPARRSSYSARKSPRRGRSSGTARSACSRSRAFAQGTLGIARAVAAATLAGATSIVGGGDSVAAVEQSGVASQISHISTGGGASLEFLAGEKLPGVEALTDTRSHRSGERKET